MAKLSTMNDEARQGKEIITGVTREYELLEAQASRTADEQRRVGDEIGAFETEKKFKNLKALRKEMEVYTSAMGKKGKLDAAELEQLKETNAEAYEKYKTLSSEEWDEYLREKKIETLKREEAAYRQLGLEVEAEAARQERENLENERAVDTLNKLKTAYKNYANELKEKSSKIKETKTAAEVLVKQSTTGELSESQKVTIKQSLGQDVLDQYEAAASAEERRVIAAKAYSQYLVQERELLEEQNALYDDAINSDTTFKRTVKNKLFNSESATEFVESMFRGVNDKTKGYLATVTSDLEKSGKLTGKTYAQAREIVLDYIREQKEEGIQSFEQIEAAGVDAMKNIWKSAAEEERKAAEKAVDDWQKAFDRIAGYRKKILSGDTESVQEEIYSSQEKYMEAYARSGAQTFEEFEQRVDNGEIWFGLP